MPKRPNPEELMELIIDEYREDRHLNSGEFISGAILRAFKLHGYEVKEIV